MANNNMDKSKAARWGDQIKQLAQQSQVGDNLKQVNDFLDKLEQSDQREEIEYLLSKSLKDKLKKLRHQEFRHFIKAELLPSALHITQVRLKGLNKVNISCNEFSNSKPMLLLLPRKESFPEIIQKRIQFYHSRKHYKSFAVFINPEQPAISLSLAREHKYAFKQKPSAQETRELLNHEIKRLENAIIKDGGTREQEVALESLNEKLENQHNYEFTFSTFERNYFYPYLYYRYESSLKYKYSESILSAERACNVVFCHEEKILKRVPRFQKVVDRYLRQFKKFHKGAKYDFYYRPKN